MAKLADALASGASDSNIMEVQVLSTAPFLFSKLILQLNMRLWRNWQTRYFEGVVFTRRMGSSPINRTMIIIAQTCGSGLLLVYCRYEVWFSMKILRLIAFTIMASLLFITPVNASSASKRAELNLVTALISMASYDD